MTTKIIIIIILIFLSAFFSASETAFSSVNKIRLRNYANQGDKKAKSALKIVNDFDKALTTILIGNNIVNIASASLATIIFTNTFGAESVGIATIVMTLIVLTFGEIIPKSFAKENAEKLCLQIASTLSGVMIILTPLTLMFVALKKNVIKFVDNGKDKDPSVTEEELKYIIDEIENEGVLEEQESNLVKSALEFDETTISEILIPRVNISGVEMSDSIEEIKDKFLLDRYTRMPVYEKTMDSIIGILHYKDFMEMYILKDKNLKAIIRKPVFISEHKRISEVLKSMQLSKHHMAIVIDQYGGTEGIVTLEDIIEELVGEIYDENDNETPSFMAVDDNTFMVSGELSLSDFLEHIDLPEDTIETECNSVGGFVMELLGHIAVKDETVSFGAFDFKVLEIDEQKIVKVMISVQIEAEDVDKWPILSTL